MSDSEDTEGSCVEWNITKEWLEIMLQEHHGKDSAPKVVEFTVRPGCNAGESVLSDILAVNVEYESAPEQPTTKLSLIVKRLPQDPYSRFFVTEAQFDLREIRFYTQVRGTNYSFGLSAFALAKGQIFTETGKRCFVIYT
jgi:hypothetical protein